MALNPDDLLLVNRSGTNFKIEYGLLKQNIINGIGGAIVSEDEPDGRHEGDLWYQPSTDSLFVWVVSNSIGAWEAVGSGDFLPLAGGNLTGGVTQTEGTVGADSASFNLSTSNFWQCGTADVPNPSGGVNGQSGLIRFNVTVTSWGGNFSGPGVDADVNSGAIVPFYVLTPTNIFIGAPVGGA